MTWNQLKKIAKKVPDYKENKDGDMFCVFNDLYFYKNGNIDTINYYVSENRTYQQMKNIIENLFY